MLQAYGMLVVRDAWIAGRSTFGVRHGDVLSRSSMHTSEGHVVLMDDAVDLGMGLCQHGHGTGDEHYICKCSQAMDTNMSPRESTHSRQTHRMHLGTCFWRAGDFLGLL